MMCGFFGGLTHLLNASGVLAVGHVVGLMSIMATRLWLRWAIVLPGVAKGEGHICKGRPLDS